MEKRKVIDLVFLIAFLILLFIPMSKIDLSESSSQENRTLAKFKPLIKTNGKLNTNFSKDFEDWFSDRFNKRDLFINTSLFIKKINRLYTVKDYVYDKKHNIIYNNHFKGLKRRYATKFAKKKYLEKLTKFNDYCSAKNIKLYILVVPRQADFLEYTVLNKKQAKEDNAIAVIKYLKRHSNLKIVYPKRQMLEANKTDPVYYSTDPHWTKKGAFVCYYELMKVIKKDFPNVNIIEENFLEKTYTTKVVFNFDLVANNGLNFICMKLGKKEEQKLMNKNFIHYKNPLKENLKREYKSRDEKFYYPNPNKIKTLVIGNSFAKNLTEILPYSFENTLRLYDNYRNFNMKEYEKIIEEYKPDIIILNFHTYYFHQILNMYETHRLVEEN